MANAQQQFALTERHRQAQLTIRAQALRDFALIWPIWKGDEQSFQEFVAAVIVLVRAYRQISAAAASAYFDAFRQAASIEGVFAPILASAIDEAQVAASIYVTGRDGLRTALDAGQSTTAAKETVFVRTSGAVTRHIANGGRQTLIDSVQNDPKALGWARITDGNPCYFCLALASRGAVYKTEQTADFRAHDHCGCTVMPVYKGTQIPGLQQWRDIYNAAQTQAEASGELMPGENSSKARLRAVRHHLEHA